MKVVACRAARPDQDQTYSQTPLQRRTFNHRRRRVVILAITRWPTLSHTVPATAATWKDTVE